MLQFIATAARLLLACIRLFNGAMALFAPQMIIRRFKADESAEDPEVAVYALRMFGIRTILIALDLMRGKGPVGAHAVRVAPIIHASDLITAALVARGGRVPKETGALIVAISGFNTLLAFLSQLGRSDRTNPDPQGATS